MERDLEQGRQLRDEGMRRVLLSSPEFYKLRYRRCFLQLLQSGKPFTSEDICDKIGDPPAGVSGNVKGAVFNAMKRKHADEIEELGLVQMSKPSSHARRTMQYRGI